MIEMGWGRAESLPGVDVVDARYALDLPEPTVLDGFLVGLYLDGATEMWRPGGVELLTPGSLLVSSPGQVVRVVRRHTPRARIRSLLVTPAAMAHALGEGPLPRRATHVVSQPEMVRRARAVYAALDDGADALAVQSTFTALVAGLGDAPGERGAVVVDAPLRRARELLHASLGRNPSLDELSAAAGLSKYHLLRRFAAAFGLPPHRYHLLLRLERARSQLCDGGDIGAIASDLAFADQSHLTRRFSRAFGVSPARYRARMLAR